MAPRIGDLADLARIIRSPRRALGTEPATRRYLMYVVLPLWIGAGLFDYMCHRRTRIEETSGAHESLIHALMMAEIGLPVLMGIFLEVNALTLAVMIVTFFAHEATAFWDVAYAETLREVTPTEQHVHSFLEVLPFMTVSFLLVLHWDQALALFGVGRERADFVPRRKRPALSRHYALGILLAVAGCIGLPYAEELGRCLRAAPTLAAHAPGVPRDYGAGPRAVARPPVLLRVPDASPTRSERP